MNQKMTLPVLSAHGRSFSTTPTGRPRSNISSSTSVHRVQISSSCSNHIFPSRLPLKKLKPEPWQRFFDGEKRQVYSQQGLTVKKNKQNVDAIINEDFFNLPDEQANTDENNQPSLPPPIQAHIDHLCEQIDDLALQLAEERLNHKQTRNRAAENLSNQLENQNKQFQELLHLKMLDHEKELEEFNDKHLKSLNEEQTKSYKREEHLKNELEFVKSSFHSYKINLDKDNAEKLQIKINEALETVKKELQEKEEEMNKKINEAIIKERKSVNARHKMEIENILKQHRKEVDTIHKTFADTAFDRVRVESLSKDLTSTKLELDDTKERAVKLAIRLKDLEIQHVEMTRELNDFRTRFDIKTKEVEKFYAGRLDQVHLQNADLRSMYMKKCADLVDERALTQKKIDEQVKLTRKQLQRKLLNIRIASAVPLNTDNEPRRLSTYATASQYELSSTRCRSAFAASHPVSAIYNETSMNNNSTTDFSIENTRRETKLRRRSSAPVTEEEQDVVRYLTSASTTTMHDSISSKYNFENETTMIKNLSLEDLQQTFKSPRFCT